MPFTWRPLFAAIVDKLLTYHNDRPALIDLLREMQQQDLKVIGLNDRPTADTTAPHKDIDPFSFQACYQRGLSKANRLAILSHLKDHWKLREQLPTDFDGIPVVTHQKAWFIANEYQRHPGDIETLWDLALAASAGPEQVTDALFQKALQIREVGLPKLTIGLFWLRPDLYFALDSNMRTYLADKGLNPEVRTWSDYLNLKQQIIEQLGNDFVEISHDAYLHTQAPGVTRPIKGDSPRYWLLAPGQNADHWDEFRTKGIMAIDFKEVGDISNLESYPEVHQELSRVLAAANPTNDARCLYEFMHVVRPGDVVFVKRGRSAILGRGTVTSEYSYESTRSAFRHVRKVDWTQKGEWEISGLPLKTLTDISQNTALLERIRSAIGGKNPAPPPVVDSVTPLPYSDEDALQDLFLEHAEFHRLKALWERKGNLILQGPPGVGKSFVARRLAYALMGEKADHRVEMVQFHQSYAYEDFVQGYRPVEGNSFELRNGVFYRFVQKALEDPGRPYVFIIDEINRGNLSRILGELMLLIEWDKRGPEWGVKLTYSPQVPFHLPQNLYLLGLMNTADRSLAFVDHALRRRFAFYSIRPGFEHENFASSLETKGVAPQVIRQIRERLGRLNQLICSTRDLGSGFSIGHSYFCPSDRVTNSEAWYDQVIEYEIQPLLEEYWADDTEQLKTALQILRS